jgi:hypothetical protein
VWRLSALNFYTVNFLSTRLARSPGTIVAMSVTASATRLFQILSANSDAFTRYLRPGLPRDAIQRRLSDAGLPLPPDDVLEFYESFDLVHHYHYEPEQPSFYGIYWLLSFDDAVELWLERRSYDFLEPRWREAFPILQEDGNAFTVDLVADTAGRHNIVNDFNTDEPHAEFLTLATMFDTFATWMTSGALPGGSANVPGHYEGDWDQVAGIAARLNPGIECWTA